MRCAGLSRRRFLIGGSAAVGATLSVGSGMLLGEGTALALVNPPIFDCNAWGARPPSAPIPIWDRRPVKILVHHTASPNSADVSEAAAIRLARSIQNFHMDGRGWEDTGQHFTVSRGGSLLEGRHRTLEIIRAGRQQVEGAHCTGQNVVAVGIENEGTYIDVDPPRPLWDRLRETCAFICQQYGIAPTEIFGHRDFKDTACPGDRLYGQLPRLRSEVAGLLGRRVEGVEADRPTWPLLRTGDRGPTVLAAQQLLKATDPAVPVDGRFDPRTAAAVRRFQTAHHTEDVNGMIGGETWPALVAATPAGPALIAKTGLVPPPPSVSDPT